MNYVVSQIHWILETTSIYVLFDFLKSFIIVRYRGYHSFLT